jgi:hypothetical protein
MSQAVSVIYSPYIAMLIALSVRANLSGESDRNFETCNRSKMCKQIILIVVINTHLEGKMYL